MNRLGETLEFRNISKRFHGVTALKNISFTAVSGEIVALVGENGAGKSTLLKILGGDYAPSSGSVLINGEEKRFSSPNEAISSGVGIIYQERQLVPELTVAENIFMGNLPKSGGFIDFRKLNSDTAELLNEFGLKLSPSAKVKSLSVAMQQMIEIIKVYARRPKLIAFDEPTTALTKREAQSLFDIINSKLRSQDIIILYVSHRMEEIFSLTDRIIIFKDGALVDSLKTCETTESEVVLKMVGRPLEKIFSELEKKTPSDEVVLGVNDLSGRSYSHVSFDLRRGEILGFFGLVGAGRTELMRGIFGADKTTSGSIKYNGQYKSFSSPSQAIDGGIAYLSEDRKELGIFPIQSVRDNVSIVSLKRLKRFVFISSSMENRFAQDNCGKLAVKTLSIHKRMFELSGGNQQKALLARWLALHPTVLILDEPTKGVDVGAKAEIYRIIRSIANDGIAVIVVSSEMPEIIGLSDRVYVMKDGEIVKELTGSGINENELITAAMMTKS